MKDYPRFYKELNDLQRLAVDSIDGPLLVLAGPGTGKTQLLSVRAGSIIDKAGIRPENILILTYTNPAAKAMKERLSKVIGASGYNVEVGTFHSFANTIIQESEEAANYIGDKILMDEVERTRAIEYILDNTKALDEIRPFARPYTYLKAILNKISELKKDGIDPEDLDAYLKNKNNDYGYLDEKYVRRLLPLSIVYRKYEEIKDGRDKNIFDERGRYDFDDMIIFATDALKKEGALREEYRKLYRYVMVDEYQDTNGAQLELIFTLLDYKDSNLMCVGDDDQSIYRFQGASVGNFKLLSERFPGMKIISLKDNYRASPELIDLSRRIISLIPSGERMEDKTLKSVRDWHGEEMLFKEFSAEQEELAYIIDKVKELKVRIERDTHLSEEDRRHPYNNIAILVRKRNNILKIIDAFLQAGIPYATDGKEDISGELRVKQLLDVLELAHIGPKEYELKDLLLYKVLSSDYFKIPHMDMLRFINIVNDKKSVSGETATLLAEFLSFFSSQKRDVRFEGWDRLRRACLVITHILDDAQNRPVHTILMEFVKEAGLFKHILKEFSDNDILRIRQLRALSSFINMIKVEDVAKPAIGLSDFMLEMKTRKDHGLPIQGSLVTLTQPGVRIYTAHGSKGLEFHSVIIPFCLQNKNWPARFPQEMIQLPIGLFKTKEKIADRDAARELALQDETRLFYVAMTRAKSNLIFTASPTDDSVASLYLNRIDIRKEKNANIDEEELIKKSMALTGLKDPFIGTEEVLRDMVENISLNPTRLNTYILCRRKFLYNDILKLPGRKKKSLVFGNCVHKALERVYKTYMDKKIFPSFKFFRDEFMKELRYQGAPKGMERDCIAKLNSAKIRGWFDLTSKNPVMPIGLERKLLITVGDNIIFTGKYDKVEWEDEKGGLVRILDYKTGKPDEHLKSIDECDDVSNPDCDGYLRQLVCYKLLFEKDKSQSRGRRAPKGSLVFIEPVSADMRRKGYKKGDYVTKSVNITEGMVAELEGLIKNIWGDIKQLKFPKLPERDEKKCGACDFDDICWG